MGVQLIHHYYWFDYTFPIELASLVLLRWLYVCEYLAGSLISILLPLLYCANIMVSQFLQFLKVMMWKSVSLLPLFFYKIALTVLGPLCFHINFRISLSNSKQNLCWEFRLGLNWIYKTVWDEMTTILNFLIHEHNIFFYLVMSLISLGNVLLFFETTVADSWFKKTPSGLTESFNFSMSYCFRSDVSKPFSIKCRFAGHLILLQLFDFAGEKWKQP